MTEDRERGDWSVKISSRDNRSINKSDECRVSADFFSKPLDHSCHEITRYSWTRALKTPQEEWGSSVQLIFPHFASDILYNVVVFISEIIGNQDGFSFSGGNLGVDSVRDHVLIRFYSLTTKQRSVVMRHGLHRVRS